MGALVESVVSVFVSDPSARMMDDATVAVPPKTKLVRAVLPCRNPENLENEESNVWPMWVTFRREERRIEPGTSVTMSTAAVASVASRRFAVMAGTATPAPLWIRPDVPAMIVRDPMAIVRAQGRSSDRPARARSTE